MEHDIWLLTASMFTSVVGSNLMLVALSVHFFAQSGSILSATGVYVAQFVPAILFTPLAWKICDRLPSRLALGYLESVSALTTLVIGGCVFANLTVTAYALLVLRGFLDMTTKAARNVALKTHADPKWIAQSNNLVSAGNYTGQTVGALLGFLLIAKLSVVDVALIDAATFILSAVISLLISRKSAVGSSSANYFASWRRAKAALRRDPIILEAMSYLIASVVFLQGLNQVARLWIPLVWFKLPRVYGAVSEAIGVAGVVAGLLLVSTCFSGDQVKRRPLWVIFFIALISTWGPFLSNSPLVGFSFYFIYMFLFETIFMLSMNRVLVRAASEDVPCLMVQFYGLGFGGMAVSSVVIGALTDKHGLPPVAIVLVALGILFIFAVQGVSAKLANSK